MKPHDRPVAAGQRAFAGRRRFLSPPREILQADALGTGAFAGYAKHVDLLCGPWPTLPELNRALAPRHHLRTGTALELVAQTPALLADGLHYEQRIFEQGRIATREDNWHDLFNALIWIEHTALKSALNARYAADLAIAGPKQRTRGQCALTHFDEAGVIVVLREPALMASWDAHDWQTLFCSGREAWLDGRITVVVFGHALLEHALEAQKLMVAKALVLTPVDAGGALSLEHSITAVASAIAQGRALLDPQELRPLPLSGIPGWDQRNVDSGFYRTADCFRPLREGRVYPRPLAG